MVAPPLGAVLLGSLEPWARRPALGGVGGLEVPPPGAFCPGMTYHERRAFVDASPALLVLVDPEGVLWRVMPGTRERLVRSAIARGWRVHHSLGELVHGVVAGHVRPALPAELLRAGAVPL